MAGTFNAVRRAAAQAAAAAKAEYERYLTSAQEPGPAIKVAPFEPGSVTPGAVVAKLATSIYSAARERARYDQTRKEAQEKIATDAEDRGLRRQLLLQSIAKNEAAASEVPERMIPLTVSPTGEAAPANLDLVGPMQPGHETIPVPESKYQERLLAGRRIEQAQDRIGLSEQAGARADESLELQKQRTEEVIASSKERRRQQSEREVQFKLQPADRLATNQAEDQLDDALYYGTKATRSAAEANLAATWKRALLTHVRQSGAKGDIPGVARAAMSLPSLRVDPELLQAIDQAIPDDSPLLKEPNIIELLAPLYK